METFKLFGRAKAWFFLLCILIANGLLLYAHYNFTHPLFYSTITWWTELWDAQFAGGFTHYPGHFILLAYYYSSAKLFIGFLIEGGLLGAVALVFYRHIYSDIENSKLTIKSYLSNWMHLSLAWGVLNGILYAGYKFLPQIFADFLWSSPRRQMIFDYGLIPMFNILIVALFFFAIPYIAIYRTNVIDGLVQSLKLFVKRPLFILFLSTAILAVPLVLSAIMNNTSVLVEKFNPSITYILLIIGLGVDLFVNFFWIGTAVNYLSDDE